jgi:hypothetical protein
MRRHVLYLDWKVINRQCQSFKSQLSPKTKESVIYFALKRIFDLQCCILRTEAGIESLRKSCWSNSV